MAKTPSTPILLALSTGDRNPIHSFNFSYFRHLLELMFILFAIFLYLRSLFVPRIMLAKNSKLPSQTARGNIAIRELAAEQAEQDVIIILGDSAGRKYTFAEFDYGNFGDSFGDFMNSVTRSIVGQRSSSSG